MAHVLIASLGSRPYDTAHYGFGNADEGFAPVFSEEYFICAIVQRQAFDRIVLLLTREAKETHWQSTNGDARMLQQRLNVISPTTEVNVIPIGNGATKADLWSIFQDIEAHCQPDDTVTLDITNGFRSLPMLFLLAIQYLRQSKKIHLKEILYGAFDARDQQTNITPAFDLTPFVTLLDWSNGVHVFEELGNLEFIAQQIEKAQESLPNKFDEITSIIASFRTLSLALDYVRPDEIFAEFQALKQALKRLPGVLPHDLQPFTAVLQARIQGEFASFAIADETDIWQQLARLRALIQWYWNQKRIVSAALLAREWVISYSMVSKALRQKPTLTLDDISDHELRTNEAGSLSNLKKKKRLTSLEAAIKPIWDDLPEVRNALAHIGHGKSKRLNLADIQHTVDQAVAQIIKLPLPI